MPESYGFAYFLGAIIGFCGGAVVMAWYLTIPAQRDRGPFEEPTPRDRHGMEW